MGVDGEVRPILLFSKPKSNPKLEVDNVGESTDDMPMVEMGGDDDVVMAAVALWPLRSKKEHVETKMGLSEHTGASYLLGIIKSVLHGALVLYINQMEAHRLRGTTTEKHDGAREEEF